jgi:hypothetical protein
MHGRLAEVGSSPGQGTAKPSRSAIRWQRSLKPWLVGTGGRRRNQEYDGPGQSSHACYQDSIDHSGGCTAPF